MAHLHALVRASLGAQLRAPAAVHVAGLDVSTRNVGVAVLRGDGALLRSTVLSSTPAEGTYRFAQRVAAEVAGVHAGTPLARVGVEDVMKTFSPGRFTTGGLFKLSRLNGIVSYACWDATRGASVDLFMPNAIRSYFGIKRGALTAEGVPAGALAEAPAEVADDTLPASIGHMPARPASPADEIKLAVMRFVGAAYPSLGASWERTRTGSYKATNFDRADAVLTACFTLAHHHELALLQAPGWFEQACAAVTSDDAAAAAGSTGKRRRVNAAPSSVADEAPLLAQLHAQRTQADAAGASHAPLDNGEGAVMGVPKRRRAASSATGVRDDTPSAALVARYELVRRAVCSAVQEALLGSDRGDGGRGGGAPGLLWPAR